MGPVIRPVLNPAKKLFFRCYGAEIFSAVMLDFAPEFPECFQWLEFLFPCYAVTRV